MLRGIIRCILSVGKFAITAVWCVGMDDVSMYVNNCCVGNQFLSHGV